MTTFQNLLITEADRIRLQSTIERARQSGAENQSGLDDLQREVDRARVVDAALLPADVVVMNSVVSLRDLESGEAETYTLVYPQNADIDQNRISVLAPVGTAIIGCRVGDVVEWTVPRGRVQLRIESVVAPETPQHATTDVLVSQS